MARVPVITSPCPLRWKSAPRAGQDFCGHCQRRVHNLDLMSAAEREAFLAGCEEKVCVSYTVRRAPRLSTAIGLGITAAAGLTASANADTSTAAAAPVVVIPDSPQCPTEEFVLLGGTEAGETLQWVDESEARLADKPDLPQIEAQDWLPTPKT